MGRLSSYGAHSAAGPVSPQFRSTFCRLWVVPESAACPYTVLVPVEVSDSPIHSPPLPFDDLAAARAALRSVRRVGPCRDPPAILHSVLHSGQFLARVSKQPEQHNSVRTPTRTTRHEHRASATRNRTPLPPLSPAQFASKTFRS